MCAAVVARNRTEQRRFIVYRNVYTRQDHNVDQHAGGLPMPYRCPHNRIPPFPAPPKHWQFGAMW